MRHAIAMPNRSWLSAFAAKHPGLISYKSPKYIKVDVPEVAILHRLLQVGVFLTAIAQLYFNDEWALSEVPSGFCNAWAEAGTMLETTDDPLLASRRCPKA